MRRLVLAGFLAVTALHEPATERPAQAAAPVQGGLEWSLLNISLPPKILDGLRVFDGPSGDFRAPAPGQVPGQRGKLLVVHLWAEWCGPCREEMPLLQKLTQETTASYGDGVEFLYVNISDNAAAARLYVAENKIRLPKVPHYLELGGGLLRWLQRFLPSEQNTLPITLILDSRRAVRLAIVGSVQPHRKALTTTLARLHALERY